MKKIIITMFAVAAFAACKKEEKLGAPTPAKPMNEQVADLIRKGDPNLYEQLYNSSPGQRAPKPSILITHGIFNFGNGQPQDGTCLPDPNCVCHITIEWAKLIDPNSPPDSTVITSDLHATYTEAGQGEIILNSSPETKTIDNLKSVDITFGEDGGSSLQYSQLEL